MMKKTLLLIAMIGSFSCGRPGKDPAERIITVSIAPFGYFVEKISGGDFKVNIMVPPGSDPHIYEPVPEQIIMLEKSEGYISNGFLGFEMAWLGRFYEVNPGMRKLNLGEVIEPIEAGHEHEGEHAEKADPHYWVSPKCAMEMAASIRDFLSELNQSKANEYWTNCRNLIISIKDLERKAARNFKSADRKAFMIYHPNLAYLARDFGLTEIAVEQDGKEPSPSGMKELIDRAMRDSLNTIFVQREYDTRNARAIALETGAEVVVIDPLSGDWMKSTTEIIEALHKSLN